MKKQELIYLIQLLEKYCAEADSSEAQELIHKIKASEMKNKAGRKPLYSADIQRMILRLRDEGKSIRKIAELTGCSSGYIHKTIHRKGVT